MKELEMGGKRGGVNISKKRKKEWDWSMKEWKGNGSIKESGLGERPGMGSEGWERRGGEMRGGGGYQERKCMAVLRRFNE